MSRFTRFYIKYVLIPCVFLLSMALLVSFTSHGSSVQTYFPCVQLENNIIPEVVISCVRSSFSSYDHYFIYGPINSDPTYPDYFFVCWSGGSVYGTIPSGYPYYFDLGRNNNTSFVSGVYGYYNGSSSLRESNYGVFARNMHYYSSVYSNSVDFAVDDDFYSNNGDVLIFAEPPLTVPALGHAQNPMNNIPTIQYPIGMHPTSVPTVPQYTAPTLTTPPSIDTSSVSSILESIYNLLAWVFESIVLYIVNFINTFVAWLQFLGNLIVWLFENYIDFLKSLWMWLYNIFEYLFSPIYNFLSNFFKFLFNEDDQLSIYDILKDFKEQTHSTLQSLFNNSWFSNYWYNFEQKLDDAFQYFSKIVLFFTTLVALGTVNGEFSIPVLFQTLFIPNADSIALCLLDHDVYGVVNLSENFVTLVNNYKLQLAPNSSDNYKIVISSFQIAGQTIDQIEIDFSWYLDFKNIGDPVISAFLVFGYFMWLHSRFPYWLRGQQGDISKATQEIGK